jgi:hypothetical protein
MDPVIRSRDRKLGAPRARIEETWTVTQLACGWSTTPLATRRCTHPGAPRLTNPCSSAVATPTSASATKPDLATPWC